jgi:pimeloyl-ACP methyl ester carboxylesterase
VSRVVVAGGFPLGWRKRGSAAEIATREAMMTLIRHGWGQDNPAFRQVFMTRFWPDLRPEHVEAFDALQRHSTTPEGAVRIQDATGNFDVIDLLPQVAAPTLVIHSRNDGAVPHEMGLLIARGIPGARFVELNTRNHTPMPHEEEWTRYLDEICGFAAGG